MKSSKTPANLDLGSKSPRTKHSYGWINTNNIQFQWFSFDANFLKWWSWLTCYEKQNILWPPNIGLVNKCNPVIQVLWDNRRYSGSELSINRELKLSWLQGSLYWSRLVIIKYMIVNKYQFLGLFWVCEGDHIQWREGVLLDFILHGQSLRLDVDNISD